MPKRARPGNNDSSDVPESHSEEVETNSWDSEHVVSDGSDSDDDVVSNSSAGTDVDLPGGGASLRLI